MLEKNRSKVMKRYLYSSTFIIDILVFVPFLVTLYSTIEIFDVILVLRVDKVFRYLDKF